MADAPAGLARRCARRTRFKLSEDIVVPPGSIAEMLRRVDAIGARHDLLMATFGHAGDGNLHVNVLTDENHREPPSPRASTPRWPTSSAPRWISAARCRASTASASPRRATWPGSSRAEVIDWQKRLKRLWDPQELLNPGKIFADVTVERRRAAAT